MKTIDVALMVVAAFGGSAIFAQSPPDTRAAFLKLIDRPRIDPAPAVRPMTANGLRLVQEHISFAVESTERVTGILVKSLGSTGRLPVVIQLHGTGGNKEQMLPRLITLANRGFVAVAIDGRYHGERAGNAAGLETPYTTAIFNAYKTGREHPFFYDTAIDVMRLIDYLETRPDVDASRIGLGGASKGGIETYLTAAVEPRVAAAVSERGVQSFKWALDHGGWDSRAWTIRDALAATADDSKAPVNAAFMRQFYDRVAPGIYGQFDAPAMLPLVAPRPLLVINGDSDPRTPMAGVRESAAAAERAYKAAGASDKFMLKVIPNLGHENTPEIEQAALEWFVRWLTP
jgi:dienelactone hydrolase